MIIITYLNTLKVTKVLLLPFGAQGGPWNPFPLGKPLSHRNFAMKFAPYMYAITLEKYYKCCTVSKWLPNNRFLFRIISISAKI